MNKQALITTPKWYRKPTKTEKKPNNGKISLKAAESICCMGRRGGGDYRWELVGITKDGTELVNVITVQKHPWDLFIRIKS